jgi:hypothetical protein
MKNNPPLFTANFISGLEELSELLYCHKKKKKLPLPLILGYHFAQKGIGNERFS